MVCFKKVHLIDIPKPVVERLLRKASLKRTSSLDMISTSSDVGTDKLFFGSIGKSQLTFTRLRTSFERFLPTLIIKFPLQNEECYYQLRFSLLSTVVFLFLTSGLSAALIFVITGWGDSNGLASVALIYMIYAGCVLLELKITSRKIKKALAK